MSNGNQRQTQLLAIAAVVIIALLGMNAYLLVNKSGQNATIEQQEEKLTAADSLNTELTRQFNEALAELEGKKTENEELNALITEQQEELKKRKSEISRAIRKGGGSKKALAEAQAMIDQLQVQSREYIATIDRLRGDVTKLNEDKTALIAEKSEIEKAREALKDSVQIGRAMAATLEEEKAELNEEKEALAEKVKVGSVLKASSIRVTPYKVRSNGKEKDTKYAKRAKRLLVCFDIPDNKVTDAGPNKFLLRIITPLGETIAIESNGSGTFSNQDDGGSEIRYTMAKLINYDNAAQEVCLKWEQENTFDEKGDYTAEVYNKGYKVGSTVFKLK